MPQSDVPSTIPGGPPNLDVRELDASKAVRSVREQYSASVDSVFDRHSRGSFDAVYDRRVMHDLMDLAPPGLDEIAAILDIVPLVDSESTARRYDLIVMDTAPTGHALRLLQMPALLQDWVRALMSIVLRYQPITGVGQLGAALLQMSKGIGRLRHILEDPAFTNVVVVGRAAALPRAETAHMLETLKSMHVTVSSMIVNAFGEGNCSRCRRTSKDSARERQRLRRMAAEGTVRRVLVAPAALPPPRGVRHLASWRARWVCLPALSSSF